MASKEPTAPIKSGREETPTFYASLNNFLRKYRIFFITLFAVIIASILVAAVWTIVDSHISTSAAKALEKADVSIKEWSSIKSGAESLSKSDAILAELDGIKAKFGRRYAAQKALVLQGRIYAVREDWTSAEKKFKEAVDLNKSSFLAPFALQEAAYAAEEKQDNEEAIKLWNSLINSYPDSAVGLPHAYFSLGTLYEESKQYTEAGARYSKLITAYPDNDWTKLARDRIILLKSQGLLK